SEWASASAGGSRLPQNFSGRSVESTPRAAFGAASPRPLELVGNLIGVRNWPVYALPHRSAPLNAAKTRTGADPGIPKQVAVVGMQGPVNAAFLSNTQYVSRCSLYHRAEEIGPSAEIIVCPAGRRTARKHEVARSIISVVAFNPVGPLNSPALKIKS